MLTLGLFACGGGNTPAEPDAGPPNEGFVPPSMPTAGADADGNPATIDWSCLDTASADVNTTVDINLTGVLNDFQYMNNEIFNASVDVFPGVDYQHPVDSAGPTMADGVYALTLPAGQARWGFQVTGGGSNPTTNPDYMPTLLLNQYFDPNTVDQTKDISAISNGVATALPAIIGLVRTPGSGVLAGDMRDCAGNHVQHAIATVSATSGQPDHLEGAQTFYLDAGAGLPVRHDQLNETDTNGLFAVFELPATATSYIQVWGFTDAADLADGQMTLLAELESPVIGDTVITGSIEPYRN